MLNPNVASSMPKPEDIIKETLVRLIMESDQIGYSMKLSSEVEGELLGQIKARQRQNPKLSELEAALFVLGTSINTLMTAHRLDMAIHAKILSVLMLQLSEQGYAAAYQELKKMHIQDVATARKWMLTQFNTR